MTENKDSKMNVTATIDGERIDLSKIMVKMEFEGEVAEVDADTAIKRSLHLVYENAILRNAVQEAKAVFEAQKQSGGKIVLPGREETDREVQGQMDDYYRKQDG